VFSPKKILPLGSYSKLSHMAAVLSKSIGLSRFNLPIAEYDRKGYCISQRNFVTHHGTHHFLCDETRPCDTRETLHN